MRLNYRISVVLSVCLFPCLAHSQETKPTPLEVVDTLEKLNGNHPSERKNHISGVCISGTFVGNSAVQNYSRSALFSGKNIPFLGRFSLAGGNPNDPDFAKTARGMAIEFKLPDGSLHHFTMLNTPVFSAATPQTFEDALLANIPDPSTGKPDPKKQQAFRDSHPDSRPFVQYMAAHNPPVSYTNSNFFSVHTFKFDNVNNQTTPVRWRFEPEDGVKRLSDSDIKLSSVRFLDERLSARIKRGPAIWRMILTIGQPGDEENNPTKYWPSDRKEIQAGVLTIENSFPQAGGACEKVMFDPLVMADGIRPTNDPVLNFRRPSYAISFARRLSGQ